MQGYISNSVIGLINMNNYASLPDGYDELHPTLLHLIFNNLHIRDILNCTMVCTSWYYFFKDKHFWINRLILFDSVTSSNLECLLHYNNEDEVLTCLKTACLYQPFFLERKDKRVDFPRKYPSAEKWELTEKDLKVASSILLFRTPMLANLTFIENLEQHNYLELFLLMVSSSSCKLSIKDKFSWRNENSYSDRLYQKLIQNRCFVVSFQGRLSPSALAGGTLDGLKHVLLGVDNGQDIGLLNSKFSFLLRSYSLRISANSTICNSTPNNSLPITMYITGLCDKDTPWLVQALLSLASRDGFGYLYLSCSEMSVNGISKSVLSIAEAGIIIYQLHISLLNKSSITLENLGMLIRHKLKCSYFIYETDEELERATDR